MEKDFDQKASASLRIAYFCKEFGVQVAGKDIPIYSGGLGVLAGDTLKACADRELDVIGVGILWRHGYSNQTIDPDGTPQNSHVTWHPEDFGLQQLPMAFQILIEGQPYILHAWEHRIEGITGHVVPLYLLDASFPGKKREHRITNLLYQSGDSSAHIWWRIAQDAILGIGGLRLCHELAKMGTIAPRNVFHLNEGHAAFALGEAIRMGGGWEALPKVRNHFAFTTHTPVAAGHDRFPIAEVKKILGEEFVGILQKLDPHSKESGTLNMTHVALQSGAVNAVAQKHREVSEAMFPKSEHPYRPEILGITNGIHTRSWISDPMKKVLDKYVAVWWQKNPSPLTAFTRIAGKENVRTDIREAHKEAKRLLIDFARRREGGEKLEYDAFTIGIARRAAKYKRLNLILTDTEKLNRIAGQYGPIQIIFSGKNHPDDHAGRDMLHEIILKARELMNDPRNVVRAVFLPNYDMDRYRIMAGGCDLWLNNPIPPQEASGTSGMGAGLNGTVNFSTPDGWWLEGSHDDATGWTIPHPEKEIPREEAAALLYEKLEEAVRTFYREYESAFLDKMIQSVALIGSHFSTFRMTGEYLEKMWQPLLVLQQELTHTKTSKVSAQ